MKRLMQMTLLATGHLDFIHSFIHSLTLFNVEKQYLEVLIFIEKHWTLPYIMSDEM